MKKKKPNQKSHPVLDPALVKYYSTGKEIARLDTAFLEKIRTLNILKRKMPTAPAVVLDVGGAYGVYAFPLAELGYEVHLIDPIPVHIEQAHEYSKNFTVQLASYNTGDARKIEREDNSVDIVLFFGPLYHLVSYSDRLQALKEAYRVLKKGGKIFLSAISRFRTLLEHTHNNTIGAKIEIVKNDITTGIHPSENSHMDLYFHHPKEIYNELQQTEFKDVALIGIEGPFCQIDQRLVDNTLQWEKLLDLLETIEHDEAIIGASAHIMAIATK